MAATRRALGAWGLAAGGAIGALAGAMIGSRAPWLVPSDLPRAIPTETDPLSEIPAHADAVVIGAGIAGISTAMFLNEFGLRTVVFEKGCVGGEASSRNFGWVYTNGLHADKLELAVDAKRIWLSFQDRFGFDVSMRQGGNTLLIPNEEELHGLQRWAEEARARFPDDIDAEILRGADLDRVVPGAAGKMLAALHQPSDGSAEPTEAVPRIAKGVRAEGVKVFSPVAVRGIETAAGAVHSVVTEHGEVRTPRVVLAGGSWSRLFLGNLGIDLPQQLIASSLLRVSGGSAAPGTGYGDGVAWREQTDGSYSIGVTKHVVPVTLDSLRVLRAFLPSLQQTLLSPGESPLTLRFGSDLIRSFGARRRWRNDEVSPFERVRLLSGRPSPSISDRALANARGFFPELADARVVERWAGIIDATPDSTSVIDEAPGIPGLVINTGHSAQGFALGPGAGRLAAEIVADRPSTVDPSHYRFSRFSDGTQLTIREFI